ncbi:helix-turn-helix domain-containing protein (plasmid) [Deinococcus taeanensis]|uniref:DNA-3-methyladenine glycosylase 2 family protein n=1 Tax=Deinococcus taeanensis TaxID=2737050 RepID=UPI001CDBB7B8|nr:Ada metal-binding domain-containing protein [Deinococcus taeanensis]UBV45105.1 helix-turn-helix domain-containing protein [Deinococcus taeanensis]
MAAPLHRELMLDRMLAADRAYDGRFITGVLSTGIYCLPSCRARKPKPENVVFHFSPVQARHAGLRPCLRCKPDDFYAGVHSDEARVDALAALMARSPAAVRNVAELARAADVSPSKVHDLFRVHLHTTPVEWLTRQRVRHAQHLLLTTSPSVAKIAFEVGFESLSAFGKQFRRMSALTPQAYRRLPQAGAIHLNLPQGYPTTAILRDLGRDPSSLTERVEGQVYAAALRLPSGPIAVQVEFSPGTARCTPIFPAKPLSLDWAQLHGTLVKRLGLHTDPSRFETHLASTPDLASLLDGGRGLRMPLVADHFDGLLWSVVGQQVKFSFACTLRRRITERTGEPLPGGLFAPPTADAVAALNEADLVGMGLTRARAGYLLNAARLVAQGRLSLPALAAGTATRAERSLLALSGLGPWSANYVMMRVFGFQDCVPLGDTALATALQEFFGLHARPDRDQTTTLMARFSPHRSLATFHLWRYVQTHQETFHDHHPSVDPCVPGSTLPAAASG